MKPQLFSISVVLNSVFFPLTAKEAFDSFQKRQFTLGQPTTSVPTGPRVYLSGTVARKGNVFVNIEHQRNLVGVQGDSIEECLAVFEEIINILTDDFGISLEENLNYAELIAQYLILSKGNAFEAVINSVELKSNRELNEILGAETSVFSYSIAPKGILPSSKNWFEITISPKLTMAKKAYWTEVIFRDTNKKSVVAFAADLNVKICNILHAIESNEAKENEPQD